MVPEPRVESARGWGGHALNLEDRARPPTPAITDPAPSYIFND
jgi:hypothetical protein